MATSLMQQAKAAPSTGPSFTPKDPRQFIPAQLHDAVERVFVAGMKMMYSPQMEQERQAAIQSQDPVPKRIADNVLGLMLTLDQQSKGGIPEQVIFPAAVMLVNEAANLLVHAGQDVTQDDYNQALQLLYVQIGKKLGLSNDQLMQGAQQALAKKGGAAAAPPTADATTLPPPAAPDNAGAPPTAMAPGMPPGAPPGMPPQGGV